MNSGEAGVGPAATFAFFLVGRPPFEVEGGPGPVDPGARRVDVAVGELAAPPGGLREHPAEGRAGDGGARQGGARRG